MCAIGPLSTALAPLLYGSSNDEDEDGDGGYLDIMSLDRRAGVAAADQLHSVARLDTAGAFTRMVVSCDGLLILYTKEGDSCYSDVAYYSVCNPATRQYAPLLWLRCFCVAGMYPHPPTGEYRLLMCIDAPLEHEPEPAAGYGLYVYALGSYEPLRDIGWPEADPAIHAIHSLLFCGDLHWFMQQDEDESCMIMIFDTPAKLFRQMHASAVPRTAELFEMDGMLVMASFNDGVRSINIWMMQDYDSAVYAFKYRVQLPVAELTMHIGLLKYNSKRVVLSLG